LFGRELLNIRLAFHSRAGFWITLQNREERVARFDLTLRRIAAACCAPVGIRDAEIVRLPNGIFIGVRLIGPLSDAARHSWRSVGSACARFAQWRTTITQRAERIRLMVGA
jgi:hypothetical protein